MSEALCSFSIPHQFKRPRLDVELPQGMIGTPDGCNEESPWKKRIQVQMFKIPFHEVGFSFYHANCVHNEYLSIRNRVAMDVPLPTASGLRGLEMTARSLAAKLGPLSPWTRSQVVDHMKFKRKLYLRALNSLTLYGITPRDAYIDCFVKAERIPFNSSKVNPDPRMISARTSRIGGPRYNLEIATFLKPIEHALYDLDLVGKGTRSIMKGLNARQRGKIIREKWDCFDDPVAFSLDCSRFDAHVNEHLLKIEHLVYKICNADPYFAYLLGLQFDNVCLTANKLKYQIRANRMSGDMNTACGNVILMCLMVLNLMEILSIEHFEIADDGDDCLVIFEKSDLSLIEQKAPEVFLGYGMTLTIDNIADEFEKIFFCKSRPVLIDGQWIMVRDPMLVLQNIGLNTKYYDGNQLFRMRLIRTIAMGELALAEGQPVIQALCCRLINLTHGVELVKRAPYRDEVMREFLRKGGFNPKVKPISIETRMSFENAFGISVERQIQMEAYLSTLDVQFVDSYYAPLFEGTWAPPVWASSWT